MRGKQKNFDIYLHIDNADFLLTSSLCSGNCQASATVCEKS